MLWNNLALHNVEEIVTEPDGNGVSLCRVPSALRALMYGNGYARAAFPAGVELRFRLLSESATLHLQYVESRQPYTAGDPVMGLIYQGDYQANWFAVHSAPTTLTLTREFTSGRAPTLPAGVTPHFDPQITRVLLPYTQEVRILGIEGDFAPPTLAQVPAKRYLAYGSSITHGFHGILPSATYPFRLAAQLGVDHYNLGFGGAALLEAEMADYIASRTDWDFATLELGINLLHRTESDEFARRVEYFLDTITARHREQWIFAIDLFTCSTDFSELRGKADEYRMIVREAVARRNLPKLVHVDGRRLLTDLTGLSSDLLHPTHWGFMEIADGLFPIISRCLAAITEDDSLQYARP